MKHLLAFTDPLLTSTRYRLQDISSKQQTELQRENSFFLPDTNNISILPRVKRKIHISGIIILRNKIDQFIYIFFISIYRVQQHYMHNCRIPFHLALTWAEHVWVTRRGVSWTLASLHPTAEGFLAGSIRNRAGDMGIFLIWASPLNPWARAKDIPTGGYLSLPPASTLTSRSLSSFDLTYKSKRVLAEKQRMRERDAGHDARHTNSKNTQAGLI